MPTLNWLTRDADIRAAQNVPYRLLEEAPALSAGDPATGNMLIQGDNLDARKALLPFYAGQVKCIYIDPPYNTGAAFEHYDDNLEHARWLATIWPRLELLRSLLSNDGSIWVSIDNSQAHYLKVIMDEIFGRRNYVTTCIWQQRTTRKNRKVFSEDAEYIHVYAANPAMFKATRNKLTLTLAVKARYKNLDNDPRGDWQSVSANAQDGHATEDQFYDYKAPNGKTYKLPPGRCWLYTESKMNDEVSKNNIWFGKKGNGVPRVKKFLGEDAGGLVPETLWLAREVGTNDSAKKEIVKLSIGEKTFDTPKPESLINRIISIATNPGDLVLDSFLGSGTAAAVAHKVNRRYIGIELGDHAVTHCAPRLKKVIAGDQGGISESIRWQGGGGFRFYRLGSPVFDAEGHIRRDISFAVLAAHIWFSETATPWAATRGTPFLGIRDGRAFALLYNGILGDKRPDGGNVLTRATLALIRIAIAETDPDFTGPITLYGEQARITAPTLDREAVTFKQTPYDVKARR